MFHRGNDKFRMLLLMRNFFYIYKNDLQYLKMKKKNSLRRIGDEIENKNDSIEFQRNYCYIKYILSINKGLLFCGLDEQVCEKIVPKAF